MQTSRRAMAKTALAVFLYVGRLDPLPSLTVPSSKQLQTKSMSWQNRVFGQFQELKIGPWNLVRTTSRGCIAATVPNPATAPAVAFSHCHDAAINNFLDAIRPNSWLLAEDNRKLKKRKDHSWKIRRPPVRSPTTEFPFEICVCVLGYGTVSIGS